VCAVRRNCAEKIFGWLKNITNSAGIRRLTAKNSTAARRRLTKFGAAALGGGAGVYLGALHPQFCLARTVTGPAHLFLSSLLVL